MKSYIKENMEKSIKDLESLLKGESQNLNKLSVAISLGREKKTHLAKGIRRKVAVLKTIIAQKIFIGGGN